MLSKVIGQMLAVFLIIIIFLIILSSDAFAFQVSPAKIVQTEATQTHNFLVRVNSPGMVQVSFEGELAEYASANTTFIEGEARIPVTITLPELTPGKYDVLVVFEKAISTGEVGANAQIAPRITYVEEFEGVYIESSATIRQNTQPLEIVTIHENFGTQTGNVTLALELEDVLIEDELRVETLTRQDYSIDYQKGEYELTTKLSNGTAIVEKNQVVSVGKPTVVLEKANVTMGNIAVFDLAFTSDWNVAHEEELKVKANGNELEAVSLTIPGSTQVFWETPQEGNLTLELEIAGQKILKEIYLNEERSSTRNTALLGLFVLLLLSIAALLFKNKERFK